MDFGFFASKEVVSSFKVVDYLCEVEMQIVGFGLAAEAGEVEDP